MWMLPARVSAVGKWTLRATAFLNAPMISTVLQPGVFKKSLVVVFILSFLPYKAPFVLSCPFPSGSQVPDSLTSHPQLKPVSDMR